MRSCSQYFATRAENLEFVQSVISNDSLHAMAFSGYPYTSEVLPRKCVVQVVESLPWNVQYISISTTPAPISCKRRNELLECVPGALLIDLGEQAESVLRESSMSATTYDLELEAQWKKVWRMHKATTRAGMWFVNSTSLARAFSRTHRYTDGALKWYLDGGVLESFGRGIHGIPKCAENAP